MKFQKEQLVISLTKISNDESTLVVKDNESTYSISYSTGFAIHSFLELVEYATHFSVPRARELIEAAGYTNFEKVLP